MHFWASWCGPCREELPSLLRASNHFKDRVRIIAISLDENAEQVKNFVQSFKIDAPKVIYLFDAQRTSAKSYGTIKLPETYILDHELLLMRKIANVMDWENKINLDYLLSL